MGVVISSPPEAMVVSDKDRPIRLVRVSSGADKDNWSGVGDFDGERLETIFPFTSSLAGSVCTSPPPPSALYGCLEPGRLLGTGWGLFRGLGVGLPCGIFLVGEVVRGVSEGEGVVVVVGPLVCETRRGWSEGMSETGERRLLAERVPISRG